MNKAWIAAFIAALSATIVLIGRSSAQAAILSFICLGVNISLNSCGISNAPTVTRPPTPAPVTTPIYTPTPMPTPTAPPPTPTPTAPPPTPLPTPTPVPVVTPVPGCDVSTFNPPSVFPQACYAPYAANSVWNTPIGTSFTVDSNSAAEMQFYSQYGIFTSLQFGYTNQTNQYQHPIFFGRSTDPTYSVTCLASWATCNFGTMTFHIPSYAQPAGGTDHHITSVDETTGYELDCWNASPLSGTGGTLTAQSCGYGAVNGSGLVFGQTAAGFAQWAGVIRGPELAAGAINHALFIVMPCTTNVSEYPSNYRTADTLCPNSGGVPYGHHLRLNMTHSQIDAATTAVPWKRPIYYALADYGGYVGDTNGFNTMSIQVEADTTYTLPGYTNTGCPTNGAPCTPVTAFMHSIGDPGYTGDRYNVGLTEIDWTVYGQWLLPVQ